MLDLLIAWIEENPLEAAFMAMLIGSFFNTLIYRKKKP